MIRTSSVGGGGGITGVDQLNILKGFTLFQSFSMIRKNRISSYSFRGNYSFLDLEIQRSQYIRPKVTVHKGAETI